MFTKFKIGLLFSSLILIAVVLLVATFWFSFDWSELIPAAMRSSRRPGNFTLNVPQVICGENQLPQASLNWTTAERASYYQVQRKVGRRWTNAQINGNVEQTSFLDTYWSADYVPGEYVYRIRAVNNRGSTYSNEQSATIPDCQDITPPPPSADFQWGAYVGWQLTKLPEFENRVGQPVNLQTLFVHWGNENEFPSEHAGQLRDAGKTMIIFWEAMDYNVDSVNQPNFSYDNILAGNWDNYFTSFADQASTYGGPVILIPFEEMNGDWYPWSGTVNNNSASKHIAAYHYVHDFFANVPNLKFGWAVNQESVPDTNDNRIEAYYPGDDYVDYVGVNGFNFNNPWQTFSEVFDDALDRLAVYNKPVYVFSLACAQGTRKAAWITDALTVQIPSHPEIVGWSWFNENKEKDWRVWSDNNSLNAFKAALP